LQIISSITPFQFDARGAFAPDFTGSTALATAEPTFAKPYGDSAFMRTVSLTLALISLAGVIAGSKSADQHRTSELQPTPITSASPAPPLPALAQATPGERRDDAPPKPEEVADAVARVFANSVKPDQSHAPPFLVGDFNGDGSPDIAVVAKASDDAMAEINNELANWTVEDPKEIPIPGTPAASQLGRPKPVKVEKSDALLAIIHGVGPQGWRNREARQTYLLKNAVGTRAEAESAEALRRSSSKPNLPPLRGDAIAVAINGRPGLIFWTGAKYAWAPQQ